MNKTADYLKDAGVFYLAAMDGDQTGAGAFGAVAELRGC